MFLPFLYDSNSLEVCPWNKKYMFWVSQLVKYITKQNTDYSYGLESHKSKVFLSFLQNELQEDE